MAAGEKLKVVMASQVGKPNGVAGLDEGGKVPEGQLPAMNYDPAGSAAAVQANLDAHTGNRNNPHGVTAQQVGAFPRFAHSTNKDFNTLIADGVYECQGLNLNTPYGSSGDTHFFVEVYRHADTWVRQIARDVRTNTTFQRGLFNGVWGAWTTIADSVVAGQTTNSFWKKIFERTTAGAFEWTAPDLFGGKPYLIGCLIIGGGGSGGAVIYKSPSNDSGASGGASGISRTFLKQVSPGTKISGVVGAGGARITSEDIRYFEGKGNNGGSTSFDGKTAGGGEGGNAAYRGGSSGSVDGAVGGQCSSGMHVRYYTVDDGYEYLYRGRYGGRLVPIEVNYSSINTDIVFKILNVPLENAFNCFECTPILGAGSSAYAYLYSETSVSSGKIEAEKNPITGLGGGYSMAISKPSGDRGAYSAIAGDATEPGCGGGAAVAVSYNDYTKYSVQSGAGKDGAIYIYVQGVAL